MAKSFHRHNQVFDVWLNRHKVKGCKIITTARTLRIDLSKSKHIIAEDFLSGFELSVLKKVQQETNEWMEKNKNYIEIFLKEKLNRRIKYKNISIFCLKKNGSKTVHCFDLKAAYPTLMKNMGIISLATWEKLLKVPKQNRMWVIGAMASTKLITEFLNGQEISHFYDVKPTKILWQFIVYEVDRFLQELFSHFRYYMDSYFSLAYYVDCLFILSDSPLQMEVVMSDLSERIFKEGYTFGYSQSILKDFDIMKKSITLADVNNIEETKKYLLSDNGNYVNSKLICND